jgi:hypothetical protein
MNNNFDGPIAAMNNENAATYIGVSPGMLCLSRHTGELFQGIASPRYIKAGRAIRYLTSDLDDWLNSLPKYGNTAQSETLDTVTGAEQ